MKVLVSVLLFILPLQFSQAAALPQSGGILLDEPDYQVRVHHEPNIEFMLTNFGLLGSRSGDYVDPEEPGYASGFEFPAGSDIGYLFQGCLWIGAQIDTIDQNGNPILDTLVSVGNDGWWGATMELMPATFGYPSIWEDYDLSDEDIHAIYYDTTTHLPDVVPDPNDQRPHIPLGLKVTQNSYSWTSQGYDELFVIEYLIQNIGTRNLHNVWTGIYYDGDVGHVSEPQYADNWGGQDDLYGYIPRGDYGIAWIADNDGQTYNGAYEPRSPLGISGLVLLRASEPILQTNFNWWISNIDASQDWGPRRMEFGYDPFPGGGWGTPGGDKAKYKVMSNGECDYDQAWCAVPREGWIPPPSTAPNIANGRDTRFLISFGPIALMPPGHVDTFTVGLIGGSGLHQDSSNFYRNLEGNESDSAAIARYYAGLDFSDLIAKADSVINIYHNSFPRPPLGAPRNFRIAEWAHNFVRLNWSPRNHPTFGEYRLFRGTQSGIYDPAPLTPPGFSDTVYTDNNVIENIRYYYAIASVDTGGRQGGLYEISVNTGTPHTPTNLVASPGNRQVALDWDDCPDPDIAGYEIYRATEDLQPPVEIVYALIDSSASSAYVNPGVANGIGYYYRVIAFDNSGNQSGTSSPVYALPMGFDSGILLVNGNLGGAPNPDYDSMTAFYHRMLSDYRYTVTTLDPDSLNDLAPYSTVIHVGDLLRSHHMIDYDMYQSIALRYLQAGGNMLIAGPKQFVPLNYSGEYYFNPAGLSGRYFNLYEAIYPSYLEEQFIGGAAVAPGFSDFGLDTTRANRIRFPRNMDSGRLYGIGGFIPYDSSEIIYNYIAAVPESTEMEGLAIGVMHNTATYKTAILEAPLYYMNESQARQILSHILEIFGEPIVGVDEGKTPLPEEAHLFLPYPNPFNAQTTIEYALPRSTTVNLTVYDIAGRAVATIAQGIYPAGYYRETWDAKGLASGVYFVRLRAGEYRETKKIALLK